MLLSSGDNPPESINVVIEIPRGSSVKYEVVLNSGAVFVDRFLYTPTHYPFNYGFIPQTKAADGDPVDALVVCQESVYPMTVIRSRPIGVLLTIDEKGPDAKIVAVPAKEIDPIYSDINSISELPEFTRKQIEHFFRHYKDSEPNKFVKIEGWEGAEYAKKLIMEAMNTFQK